MIIFCLAVYYMNTCVANGTNACLRTNVGTDVKTNIKAIMDKNINAKCICKYGLPWVVKEVIMLDPCEHLIHRSCFNKLKTKTCPMCNQDITRIISKDDYKYDPQLYQKCIDILSVSNFDKMSRTYTEQIVLNIPNLLGTVVTMPFARGVAEGKQLCRDIFSMNNIEIKVRGLNKIKEGPHVFIANHTSHLDFFAIFYVLGTGFLSSSEINKNIISKQLTKILPLLLIDRGQKGSNTVDKMREYVEKHQSICLFPEGMITHPNTIIKFRTGAFHVGYPVYPIVLKYSNVIADMSASNFILKMASKQKQTIEMHILDPSYPPFNSEKIEKIRTSMCKRGKMMLSRVSNRDIVEN